MMPDAYVHLSDTNHGPVWRPKPRLPRNPSSGEPRLKRICACPTVAGCFAAQTFDGNVYVYSTTEKPDRCPDRRHVWDAHITGEVWYTRRTEFRLATVIPCEVVSDICDEMTLMAMDSGASNWAFRLGSLMAARTRLRGFDLRGVLLTDQHIEIQITRLMTRLRNGQLKESA